MRIDEQSRLIMILKERGDEYIRKSMALDEYNQHLLTESDKHLQDIDDLNKKIKLLNKRFDDLAENHQEMIKIKDDYKLTNISLLSENRRLNLIINSFQQDQHQKEKTLHETIQDLNAKCKNYEETIQNMNSQVKLFDEQNTSKFREYDKLVIELQDKLKNKDLKINGL